MLFRSAGERERGAVSDALLRALPMQAAPVPLTRNSSGRRVSTNDCYLEPARSRASLTILGDSEVDCLLFGGRRFAAVRLMDGREFEAGEVIVCAGAVHTPAILLRSSVDTPGIGDGLKDHAAFPVPIVLADGVPWDPAGLPVSVVARLSSGESPADLQLLPLDHLGASAPRIGMVMVALMEVRSTGTVRLDASDPRRDPVVDFNLLSDETDARRLLSGVQRLQMLLDHPAMRALGTPDLPRTDLAGVRANLGD